MTDKTALILILPACLLLLYGFIPGNLANRQGNLLRQMTTLITGGQCVLATLLVLLYSLQVFFDLSLARLPQTLNIADFNLLMLDGISCLMFSLVSFVGWIICQNSIHLRHGEPSHIGNGGTVKI